MRTINGEKLKEMLISGSNNLYNHYPEVDALNVFPVPDGDTGMNMNLTCTSGSKEIQNRNDLSVGELSKAFSKGLLMGARGNSGVITSQIFRGFAQGLLGLEECDAMQYAKAWQSGVDVAYKAVLKPVEGTILTVVRESAAVLNEEVKEGYSIEKCTEILLQAAKESLDRTPELLPILKEVGVVDSGGSGLVCILEGMLSGLKGNIIERNKATATESTSALLKAGEAMEDEEFGYCTEFIMELGPDSVKKPFNQTRFTNWLLNKGNSLVVVRDDEIVKVHVHTLTPGQVLNYAQQYGEFKTLKIENMTEQHHALESGAYVEAHKDLIEEPAKPREKYALIAVSAGEGISEFFKDIGVNEIVYGGQTMNPSTEDFITAIKKCNAENVIILPNNGNIIMAASQAADVLADEINVMVIPSKTIPQGISAAIAFSIDAEPGENLREMKSALKNVKSGQITFAIRDTEIDGVKVVKDDFMGIMDKEIVVCKPVQLDTAIDLIDRMVDEDSAVLTILTGEASNEEETAAIVKYCEDKYPDLTVDVREGGQPVYSYILGVE